MKQLKEIITALVLTIFILTLAIMATLAFKPSYAWSQQDIQQVEYQLPEETIQANYSGLIDYMFASNKAKLKFQELPMSPEGEIHFKEVKVIFKTLTYVMLVAGVLSTFLVSSEVNKGRLRFFNWTSLFLFLIPALLTMPLIFNFNETFVKFHQLAFSNNYWIFDPAKDPIIRYLPESLFFKNALVILGLLLFSVLLLQLTKTFLQGPIKSERESLALKRPRAKARP